jgi:hypothetical protein
MPERRHRGVVEADADVIACGCVVVEVSTGERNAVLVVTVEGWEADVVGHDVTVTENTAVTVASC